MNPDPLRIRVQRSLLPSSPQRQVHLPQAGRAQGDGREEPGFRNRLMSALRLLNPEYVTSRYPDAANGIPAENYDAANTEMLIKAAEKVWKWVTSAFEKRS